MQCSCTAIFLFAVSVLGSLLSCICGIFALTGTLELFKTYGPVKGRGNPALDDPPKYWVNPQNGVFEPINYNNRGNFVPIVFDGLKYFLIALAVLMVINCFLFLVVATRSKKVVNDRSYQGKRNSLSCIGCVGWLAGYLAFLSILWLVIACFSVLPLVEYVITMQRCWDLKSTQMEDTQWSPGTSEKICVDLVQYGLVYFKETSDAGYALVCGPGGNHDPPRGDLEGFCENYSLNFGLYLASFISACITLFAMVLFAMRLVSTFVYLKVRRYENPVNDGHPGDLTMQETHYPYRDPTKSEPSYYGNSVANPNYEENLLSRHPTRRRRSLDSSAYSAGPVVPETIELKQRYFASGDSGRNHHSRSPSFNSDYPVPAYDGKKPPSYQSSSRSFKHRRNDEYRRDRDRSRRRSGSYDSDPSDRDPLRRDSSDPSSRYSRSDRHHRSTRRRQRSRDSLSDHDDHGRSYRYDGDRRRERQSRSYHSYSD